VEPKQLVVYEILNIPVHFRRETSARQKKGRSARTSWCAEIGLGLPSSTTRIDDDMRHIVTSEEKKVFMEVSKKQGSQPRRSQGNPKDIDKSRTYESFTVGEKGKEAVRERGTKKRIALI